MAKKPERPGQKESSHYLYRQYGKASSTLEGSGSGLSEVRKNMIRYALDQPISDIRTYSGYKGDLLIEITMNDEVLLPKLKDFAEALGMSTVIKKLCDIRLYKIYCIVPDDSIYPLKEPV